MKIINPKIHGYLDFLVVIGFLAAPSVLGLSGLPAIIAYTLAVVHLIVTLVTAFPAGMVKILPLKFHGLIELVVSLVLIALPWLLGFAAIPVARNFYVAVGILIFLVWLVTDYKVLKNRTVTPEN